MPSVKCPECGERVKIREDGKPTRCAECGTSFRVKERDDDEDDRDEEEAPRPRPKRKPKPAKKSSGTKIAVIIVGSILALGVVGLAVVLIVRGGKDGESQPIDQSKVTVENFKSVKPGMDLAEVESILGGSKSSSEDDMRDAFRKGIGDIEAAFEAGFSRGSEGTNWRRWEGKNLRVWVAFAKAKDGSRAAFSTALEQNGGASKRVDGFMTFAGASDLDKLNDDRKKEDAIRKDGKWIRGPQARELILGEWRDDQVIGGYLFAPGKVTNLAEHTLPNEKDITYRIIDERFLEITTPSLFNPPPGHPPSPLGPQPPTVTRFEYLVNRDEMVLIDATPRSGFGMRSYYRMPAQPGSTADTKLIAPLVADVKSGDFTKRHHALHKLKQLGKGAAIALPPLRDMLKQTRDANTRNEIESVIQALEGKAAPW